MKKILLGAVTALTMMMFSGCVITDGVEAAKYVASEKIVEPLKDHRFYSCVNYFGEDMNECPVGMELFRIDPIRTFGEDIEVCYAYKPNDWDCTCPEKTQRVVIDLIKGE